MSERRVAMVTGGGRGIGLSIVQALARQGAAVVVGNRTLETAQAAAAEAEAAGTDALACRLDVSDPRSVQEAVAAAEERFGRVDWLVNNAGITRDGLLMRMEDEAWQQVLSTNLTGTYLCSKAVIRGMVKRRYGRIVNVGSVVGAMGNAGQTNYAASKAGMVGFTMSLAREVAARGITVNAVSPGYIRTDMTGALPDKAREQLSSMIPMQRLGEPEDVAGGVLFLLSDAASYVTGQVLHINGGMYM